MEKRQIVNIINFIRAVEPRLDMDLITPVKEQIRLMKEHKLSGTFLVQYDALITKEFTEMLKKLDPSQFELGVWLEIVEPLVEKAGLIWRGRYPWDWYAQYGFSVGYTKPERKKIIDVLFSDFKDVFGYYPRVFGSWMFDSYTARYISDTYGLDAMCNCKEQYGTDGYTLWGGYYGQGYYPSRNNIFMPAQNDENRLQVPLFRMLGSDPVYQYDFGTTAESGAAEVQGVITLEPVNTSCGGGMTSWVDWFMRENFNGDCLSFGYAQAGQENSFGWDRMKAGLEYQFALFEKLRAENKISVETLGMTGRWFKEKYKSTPASAITAYSAYNDKEKSTVWYSSEYYRINLYIDHGVLRVRDMHIFSDDHTDPYERSVCTKNEAVYETLPVIDGNRNSGNGVLAGLYICDAVTGKDLKCGSMTFTESEDDSAVICFGCITVSLKKKKINFMSDSDFIISRRIGVNSGHIPYVIKLTENKVVLCYQDTKYSLMLEKGVFTDDLDVESEGGIVSCVII